MKNLLKPFVLLALLGGMAFTTVAQTPAVVKSWKKVAFGMPDEWYGTADAKAVAENVLLYQRESGGWPKNKPMHNPLTPEEKAALKENKPGMEASLDNDATTTEMRFMAKMYNQTKDEKYRKSFEKALDYILEAQYDNGGWPQFYPLREGYYTHITYNDNCMVNIMDLLRDIFNKDPMFAFVETDAMIAKAKKSFDKGVECILKTQIICDGKPSVWCAQHDENTLAPAKARAYELPSFSGGESGDIICLLMEIPNPSKEIINAVEGAISWLQAHKIEGIKVVWRLPDGSEDRHIEADPNAPTIWARFYDLDTQKPYFCGRDGVKREKLADIEYERRNGYGYYTYAPQRALDAYPAWKAKWNN